jgi:RNA polymerase sigma-70 factor (ECF subfamily)
MSVARTRTADPSAGNSGKKANARESEPPPSSDGDAELESRVPPRPPSLAPKTTLNSRAAIASNNKQARAREAEEDRALIARAQSGDMVAFRQLVERHQRRAFAIALALVRDEHDARELVQEAFLRVYKGLSSFQGGSSFFTWLYRIITNLSIDLIRKPGRQTSDLDDARLDTEDQQEPELPFLSRFDGADPLELVRRREIGARLQQALDALPSYHRAVIVMREIEGLSYEEMAQAMDVSKGTIMSRLFHARQKLQRALVDCYQEQVGVAPRVRDEQDEHDAPASSEEGDAS